jgi:hypothetical protein
MHAIRGRGLQLLQTSFLPSEKNPGTYLIGGYVGLRAGLDTEGRGKIIFLCRGSNPT